MWGTATTVFPPAWMLERRYPERWASLRDRQAADAAKAEKAKEDNP